MFDPFDPYHKLPDVSDYEYIVMMWNECGMMSRGGMSLAPLTWQEIQAYSQFNDIDRYEANVVISMSRAFVEGLNMTEMTDKAPYTTEMNRDELIARERSIDKMMGF
jgi:hypothetical protein